jgi:hypothetical protein
MNAYVERIRALVARVSERRITLPKKRGAEVALTAFLLPPAEPITATEGIRVPTQAFSEFLINREMGDWAEELVASEVCRAVPELKCCRYGRSENLVAGEPGFTEFYTNYVRELRTLGKRPDILIFRGDGPDEALFETAESDAAVSAARRACAAFEVRSSQQSLQDGRDAAALSFTPKVEDIHNVVRWIERHGVPHFYVQVLFGGVYAISFEQILRILAEGEPKVDYRVESAEKSQFKPTYYIPLTAGVRLSVTPEQFEMPTLSAFAKRLPRGRMLFGVKFCDGRAPIELMKLRRLLEA